MKKVIYPVEKGYDLVSEDYDNSKWSNFWEQNEAPFVRKWLQSLTSGWGLDAGAGTGKYLNDIIGQGHSCIELDISANMLAINRRRHKHIQSDKFLFEQARIDKKIFIDGFFNWILCTRVLSHCKDLERQLKIFNSYLKVGAECFISDIHAEHLYSQTSFTKGLEKVYIETYKHSLKEYQEAITGKGLQIKLLKEFRLADLSSVPDPQKFKKLYRDANARIFFILILKKTHE